MNRLVTVAAFDIAARAELAKNILDQAGIVAHIQDEGIVGVNWMLSNAVGGVKVKVQEQDAERAAEVIQDLLKPSHVTKLSASELDELTSQALAAATEDEIIDEASTPELEPQNPNADDPIVPMNRDKYAWRAFATLWISLWIWPLVFYSLYLFFKAVNGTGPISRAGKYRVWVVGFMLFGCFSFSALASIFAIMLEYKR